SVTFSDLIRRFQLRCWLQMLVVKIAHRAVARSEFTKCDRCRACARCGSPSAELYRVEGMQVSPFICLKTAHDQVASLVACRYAALSPGFFPLVMGPWPFNTETGRPRTHTGRH